MEREVGVVPLLPPSPPPDEGDPARTVPSSSSSSSSSSSPSSDSDSSSLGAQSRRREEQQQEEGGASHRKEPCPERGNEDGMKRHQTREVVQGGSDSVMEAEACSNRQGPAEESPTAQAYSTQKTSLTSCTPAPGRGLVTVGTMGPAAPPDRDSRGGGVCGPGGGGA
ncbi:serrate RNA effector molecule homolog isoform X1 [Conger conger]|uniref:serrate RNA effector molecule homolog isoform X1 n=1 Tax=Conger conger TaxID=82655 RepID=UPI002A5A9E4D|nr:serrate RNA effector molecule homolog isoform X1 [Conger conger]